MGKKLYVGNLPFSIQEQDLREIFAQIGAVESVKLITDRETGRMRGFGFVEMTTDELAQAAIQQFNGAELEGRKLTVNEARPMDAAGGGGRSGGGRPPRGGGGGDRGGRGRF